MAEELNKGGLMEQAKEMLQGKLGEGGLMDQAKDLLQGKAGELLGDPEELKKKMTDLGKKLAPDSLDDKVGDMVDKAVDFLKDTLGKKK